MQTLESKMFPVMLKMLSHVEGLRVQADHHGSPERSTATMHLASFDAADFLAKRNTALENADRLDKESKNASKAARAISRSNPDMDKTLRLRNLRDDARKQADEYQTILDNKKSSKEESAVRAMRRVPRAPRLLLAWEHPAL